VLTNLMMDPSEAEQCWRDIIDHYEKLSDSLGRRVSLRTAICDYFCSIHKSLKNPKVVEIQIFETAVKASKYDSLTGLLNRQSFDEALNSEINRAKRHTNDLSLLFFDLDDFKKVNDTLGHPAGDAALKAVAKIIIKEKRVEDIAARYGGEEMVVILPETGKMNALVLGERIRQKVEKMRLKYKGNTIRLTMSGGLAAFPVNAASAAELIKCADNALYRAKGSGKNNISFFSPDKRRYLRIDLDREVKVRQLDFNDTQAQIAKGKNICVGGILFENDYPLPIRAYRELLPIGMPIYASIEVAPTTDAFRRVARQLWKDRVDGIYLFNFFTKREGDKEPPNELLNELGRPHTIPKEVR